MRSRAVSVSCKSGQNMQNGSKFRSDYAWLPLAALEQATVQGLRVGTAWEHADGIGAVLDGSSLPLYVELVGGRGMAVWWSNFAASLQRPLQFYSRREKLRVGADVWQRLLFQLLHEGRAVSDDNIQMLCVQDGVGENAETHLVLRCGWGDGAAETPPRGELPPDDAPRPSMFERVQ